MGTIKSGWLQKLSGFFKNTWKKRYFVLYQSGDFCYYQDPHDKEVDGKINMKTQCRHIAVGHAVGEGVKAPKDVDAMFSVVSTERTFYLVADSASEAREWVTALEQARAPISYGGSGPPPQQAPYGYNPQGPVGPPPAYSQVAPGPYPMPNPQSAYPPAGQAYPPQPQYPQYPPAPYPQQGYPQQPYPQQPPPGGYRAPPPGAYPQQQYQPRPTVYAQGQQPQTVYVQNPNQGHKSSGKNKMLMGAGAGALGGAAMGYMLGRASGGGFGGGFGGCHGGYGGWDSDHSWSSGGSFDCDFD